jgi:hypothetical protein
MPNQAEEVKVIAELDDGRSDIWTARLRDLAAAQPGVRSVANLRRRERLISHWAEWVRNNWTPEEFETARAWAQRQGWYKPRLIEATHQ